MELSQVYRLHLVSNTAIDINLTRYSYPVEQSVQEHDLSEGLSEFQSRVLELSVHRQVSLS